jgi:hypothetical protein
MAHGQFPVPCQPARQDAATEHIERIPLAGDADPGESPVEFDIPQPHRVQVSQAAPGADGDGDNGDGPVPDILTHSGRLMSREQPQCTVRFHGREAVKRRGCTRPG